MMTQLQAIEYDELSVAQASLDCYLEIQANAIAPSDIPTTLGHATQDILDYSFFLAAQKTRSKTDYKQLLNELGWKGEEKRYLKVASTFEKFSPSELANVEPATIFQLANNSQKYQSVIESLPNLPQITQAAVRSLIQQQRKPRQPQSENLSIWRHTESGNRYCQIPPIHETDNQTGLILQRAIDEKDLLPQAIIREAMQLWQAYHEGRLIAVESDLPEEQLSAAISVDAPVEPIVELGESEYVLEPNLCVESGDNFNIAPPTPKGNAEHTEQESTELSPTQILIHAFQSSTTWAEISQLLTIHSEFKQQAWKALTPKEKRRVIEITPLDIKKLSSAKKAGLIVDFKEVRESVYQVQSQGSLFWDVVSSERLDAFLTQSS